MLGDADPIVAVQEAWNPGRYDEVVVCTLAAGASQWLQIDLPHRVAKLTDCQVRHVSVPMRRPAPASAAAPPSAGRCSSAWRRSCARGRARAPPERGQPARYSFRRVWRAWASRRPRATWSAARSPTTTQTRSARVIAGVDEVAREHQVVAAVQHDDDRRRLRALRLVDRDGVRRGAWCRSSPTAQRQAPPVVAGQQHAVALWRRGAR